MAWGDAKVEPHHVEAAEKLFHEKYGEGPLLPTHPDHLMHPERPQYRTQYEAWAGNQKGRKPDFERCCESVHSSDGWSSYQCKNKAKFDPDHTGKPTKCGVHSFAAFKRREVKGWAQLEANAERARSRKQVSDARAEALTVVQKIADGHNDPRSLCLAFMQANPELFK